MRVWLIDERRGQEPGGLEAILSQLVGRRETGLVLLHQGPFQPETLPQLRMRNVDVVVLQEGPGVDGPWLREVLEHGIAVALATLPERAERFLLLAEAHPIVFVPARPSPDCLWLALVGAQVARRRQEHWKAEIQRLQQRLNDRVIIERAKGVLVQRLHITEEEAYRRLRVLSRRQRRQIRDIAQSLLDAESLLLPESNGCNGHVLPAVAEELREA